MSVSANVKITLGDGELQIFSAIHLHQSVLSHHVFEIEAQLEEIEKDKAELMKDANKLIGSSIIIEAVDEFNREHTGELYFKGIITSITNRRADSFYTNSIVITGKSPTILLNSGPNCSTYLDSKLKTIINNVVSEYPSNELSLTNSTTFTQELNCVFQYNQSDWEFLKSLAIRYGQWLFYDGEKTYFGDLPKSEKITLSYLSTLTEASLEMSLKPINYKFHSNDYLKNKAEAIELKGKPSKSKSFNKIGAEKSDKVFSKVTHIMHGGNYKDNTVKQNLDELAKKQMESIVNNMFYVHGESSCLGLKIGQIIGFEDVGIDGNYFVVEVDHDFRGDGSYTNSFKAIPIDAKAPYYMDINFHIISEAQTAIVRDNKDPEGLGRLRVQFPWQIDANSTTNWIRVSRPSAGSGEGMYFMPEIDDEVFVMFEFGDINRPIIVGSLWNGKRKSGFNDSDNNKKIIQTRSGNNITFDDTSGKELIIIKDKNGNLIKIDTQNDSIEITALKNIKLTAGEKIELTAGTDIQMTSGNNTDVTCGSNFNVESGVDTVLTAGNNIETTSLNTKVNAGAEMNIATGAKFDVTSQLINITGGGIVEISGPMVKLN